MDRWQISKQGNNTNLNNYIYENMGKYGEYCEEK